ncbi:hypothetical protein M422DRAFT_242009 [Sphaerobolus stellatus SS14]|nr:hypothetical protein M422DRAFT_242009 [Sphaerobolus stellatus SS14]
MNALREEIKETISATIKDKLCSDADSITTVSHSMTALDANAQYWSDLSNKVACCSHRALELQLKMAEEKVNTLLYEEAPEEVLLEAAREACNIHFQLDQNTCLHEAGLMPEQQVRFRTDPGGSINNPSREYGVNPIHEVHIAQQETDAPLPRQSTLALLMTAQLDGAVVNRTSQYGGIQQMVRQAIQNASHEAEPEISFLAKASVKMGNPPTYSGKVQLQFLGQCLTDEAQEWFYWKKWFMLTLLKNKVAVNYDTIMQGSMIVQQLHSKSTVQYGLNAKILLSNEKYDEYFDIANVNYYDVILGTPFLHQFEILLDFKNNCVKLGKLSFPNRIGHITPIEADENENHLLKEKLKALPTSNSK